ncbi:MAG: hypothetical protein KC643_33835 [Nitrospira sp.]|nr:hypothetical protein [Nitrospira sp.]
MEASRLPMEVPNYIRNAEIIGAPIKYKWNNKLALKFYAAKDQNVRLYEAVDKSSFKAKLAIGIAITEWIIWRFEGHINLKDAQLRTQAGWVAVIDPAYVKTLEMDLSKGIHDSEIVKGPLEITLEIFGLIYGRYAIGNIYLAEHIVKQAMRAQHLLPDKKIFSDWLTDAVKKTAKVFPRETEYDEDTGIYDASHEKPVPREFFEPSFSYSE